MKFIKSFFTYSLLLAAVLLTACNMEPQDVVTQNAAEGHGILSVKDSKGKVVGTLLDSVSIDVKEVDFTFDLKLYRGGKEGTSYQIVKSFYGATKTIVDVPVETITKLPYQKSVTSVEELLEGFEGLAKSDLQKGDQFVYSTIMVNNGQAFRPGKADGQFALTVACLSQLEGEYTINGTRDDGATYSFDATVTADPNVPGTYTTSRSGSWGPGVLATPSGEAPMVFSDVCNEISIPEQGLGNFYSNKVYGVEGASVVTDPTTNSFTLTYVIEFSSGNRTYTDVYTLK